MAEKNILIIDDSDIDRDILKCILMPYYKIETAENGYKGIERILKGGIPKIDGILLDLHMPIMDGFGVLELLKENQIRNIPVVIITVESTSDNLFKAVPYRITDFICKPYDTDEIIERLQKAFG